MTDTSRRDHPGNCSSCGSSCGPNTTMPTEPKISAVLAPLSFTDEVDPALWNRLVRRITKDAEFGTKIGDAGQQTAIDFAGRILNQTVGFLELIAHNPGVGFSPSRLVDIGWHNFILYTREYAQFCHRIAGRFIHHAPFDEVGVDYGTGHAVRTVDALRAFGWPVDDLLWTSDTLSCDARLIQSADCGQCEPSRGYDCGACSTTRMSSPALHRAVANNGNCGTQDCSDACGGPDGFTITQRTGLKTLVAINGNCGSQDSGDACGGGQDGGSDGN